MRRCLLIFVSVMLTCCVQPDLPIESVQTVSPTPVAASGSGAPPSRAQFLECTATIVTTGAFAIKATGEGGRWTPWTRDGHGSSYDFVGDQLRSEGDGQLTFLSISDADGPGGPRAANALVGIRATAAQEYGYLWGAGETTSEGEALDEGRGASLDADLTPGPSTPGPLHVAAEVSCS